VDSETVSALTLPPTEILARPKSRIFAEPRLVTKMFGGLDVAMDDASVVSGVESVGAVDTDFEEAFEFERVRGDDVLERGAVEKFHGDEGATVFFTDVVDGADVRVIQRG